MLSIALALAAATPTVVDAERAFAKLAQDQGQWTAFRATAAPDGIVFWPTRRNALEALKGLKDPPKAVRWWPVKAWQSCDDSLGVTTGFGQWPDGRYTQFTTVWARQPRGAGWKWVYDYGGDVAEAAPEPKTVPLVRATCEIAPPLVPMMAPSPGSTTGRWTARDNSLTFSWTVDSPGRHSASVIFWTGRSFDDATLVTPKSAAK